MKQRIIALIITVLLFNNCSTNTGKPEYVYIEMPEFEEINVIDPDAINIKKELLYDKYTLTDTFAYKDTFRVFHWHKMRPRLALVDAMQKKPVQWAILQNYKNKNGIAPLTKEFVRNEYELIADTFGVERYQSVPLYFPDNDSVPHRYGRDGSLVKYLGDTLDFTRVATMFFPGEWLVPKKYIKQIADTVIFNNVIFIDCSNQHIATLEKADTSWLVRSMNPATTGRYLPPYMQKTPPGIFVLQEKKSKMVYLKDGSPEVGGFAPYASRFCNGGYIHGVPSTAPREDILEYSSSLGTTPRSHMCIRNATSHAKFIYDWAPTNRTLIFILE